MNKESDGERAIRVTLEELGIAYEQEKEINFLKGDFKGNRRADFFLPKYNLYIEYLGGWEKQDPSERDKERERYNQKKEVYNLNGLQCLWIYPNQLNYVSGVIKKGLEKFGNKVEPLKMHKNPLIISILMGLILLILSFANSIFFIFLAIDILFIILFYTSRCPNCKRVFVKQHVSKDFEKMGERPFVYNIETKYFYSDGSYKNSTFSEEKRRFERIKVYKNVKECKKCGYKWTENEEVNLDKDSRPQLVYRRKTHYRNPENRRRY